MLSEFSVKNIYSFRDDVTLSFKHAPKQVTAFKNNTIYEFLDQGKKKCILNGGLILGANASGKSNFKKCLKHFSSFIRHSFRYEEKSDLRNLWEPFKFSDNPNNLTEFDIELIITKEVYSNLENDFLVNYSFKFDNEKQSIEFEKFSYQKILKSKLTEEKILFLREQDEISDFTSSFSNMISKIQTENIDQKLIISMLFYDINKSFYSKDINKLEYALLESFINYTTMKMKFTDEQTTDENYILKINKDETYRKYILNSLKNFDFGIKDFEIEDITEDLLKSIPEKMKDTFLNLVEKRKFRIRTVHEVEGNRKLIDLEHESNGTHKFLRESVNIYESISNNGLYFCDEFESAFHERIQAGIINHFINANNKTQFLLITHNPYLLNRDLFSKEQIFFVEKDYQSEQSEIYSLNDFDISYNNHNWTKLYLDGRFGAIPEVMYYWGEVKITPQNGQREI
ncbi:TPA: AAA family ATPase [Staphylococcus pseudintermedius]